jgi:hypothetical protein
MAGLKAHDGHMTNTTAVVRDTTSGERAELASVLAKHRGFLRHTVDGLDDEQAARRTTASELCLGGLIKHVTMVEMGWVGFIEQGPGALAGSDPEAMQAHADSFRMLPGETLAGLLDAYAQVAAGTETLLYTLPSLDSSQPLPEAPWFEPGARWSARQVFLHILAETSQHAGHADIIRESLDGAKTMG